MHKTKRKIIDYLRYNPGSRFADLQQDEDSNKLSYHLKVLEQDNIIEKKDSKYYLTREGKKLLNFLSETAETRKQPVSVVALIPEKDGKVLLQERLKEPWYGYWLVAAGKIEFGESFAEAIQRELKEETGLSGEPEFIGMVSSRSYDKEKLTYHVHMYCYKIKNLKGQVKKVKEGKNKWFRPEEVDKIKMHPLDHMIFEKRNDRVWLIEQDEYFDGEKLKRTETRYIIKPRTCDLNFDEM